MHHFFTETLRPQGGTLSAADSHHASRVLRLSEGATISVSDGQGRVYRSELTRVDKNLCHFGSTALLREEAPQNLHLAVAPTKSNERFEFFLEKATELGIARITPLLCHHSERKVYKRERGQKIIMAAAKQSKKGRLPQLDELRPLSALLAKRLPEQRYLAHLRDGEKWQDPGEIDFNSPCTVLIGPEGDFSADEVRLCSEAGFLSLQLGSETLRTETAALAVAAFAAYQRNFSREKL